MNSTARSIIVGLSLLLIATATWAQPATRSAEAVRVIFDSDMDGDCDDVAALALLHALADRGEAQILATIASGRSAGTPACLSAINAYYGRGDLPIGRSAPGGVDRPSSYTKAVAQRCPHPLRDPGEAEDAVALYRRVLAAQPDQSVVIASVGFHTNLAALLKSPTGTELVRQKVRLWACMGGNFIGEPAKDDLKLGNVNFQRDAAASLCAITHFPSRIVFVGREVASMPSGLKIGAHFERLPQDHPVRIAYEAYFKGVCKDRHIADPATVFFAVRGADAYWDVHARGRMDLQPDMQFQWINDPTGNQTYLLKRKVDGRPNDRLIETTIEDLILAPPQLRQR